MGGEKLRGKKKYVITFVNEEKSVEAEEGMSLLDVEIRAGLSPDAPCGGMGTCGKCKVKILDGAHPGVQKACGVRIAEDLTVDRKAREEGYAILEDGIFRPVPASPREKKGMDNHYLAAFDIGTTTLVGYLMDGGTGRELAHTSRYNPQTQFGADVILRCNYVLQNAQGQQTLSDAVVKAVNGMLSDLARQVGISREDISQAAFVGNTCMHHLFLGLNPESLVRAPYVPAQKEAVILPAREYGIDIHSEGEILFLPNIGGFVGADTVGCLLAADFDHREKMTLLLDIGTNGEMVLGDRRRMIACSTAAGPAFEGAKISCGMRGAKGAIDHFHREGEALHYSVIGQGQPLGLCGSGLMDLVCLLLETGMVEPSGRLCKPEEAEGSFAVANRERLRMAEGMQAFYVTDQVYLTQKDIREVQLAKGAMAAGISLMCKELGISPGQIQEVLIAGAFGNYMDSSSACGIGLIPAELKDRIHPVGNAAGEGAKLAVISQREFEHACEIYRKVEFMELAAKADFQDVFVDELEFPEGM